MKNQSKQNRQKHPEVWEGGVYILFSAMIFLQTQGLTDMADLVPRTMGAVIGLMGALQFFKGMTGKTSIPPVAGTKNKGTAGRLALLMGAMLVFWLVQQVLGFYSAAALFQTFYYLYFCSFDLKVFPKAVLFSVITTALLYAFFNRVLMLMTPEGLLF